MLQIAPQHVPHFSMLDHRMSMEQPVAQTPSVQLPRKLARPPFTEIDPRAIEAVAPELANVPLAYIQKHLASQAPQCVPFLSH